VSAADDEADPPPVGLASPPVSPTATATRILVESRFNGPPTSANGGYACGRVARFVDGPAEVTLRRPVPLDTPLDAERHDDGSVTLRHAGELLAEGGPALPLDHVVPPHRPSVAEARQAIRHRWEGRPEQFADCYVCSPDRPDGLGVHFGPLPGRPELTAALLVADATVPHSGGAIAPEIAWAALDCPSYAPPLWAHAEPSLLARMTAELFEPIELGRPVVVVGWSLGEDGRKHTSASALLAADGRMLGRAEALWIRLRPAA
jgi:hypothetical protein